MADCVNALKAWTGKASATVVFDSTVDEFTADGLFNTIQGKPNIAIVATTTDGDVFGAFYSVAVTEQWKWFDDPNIFAFSFESRGRCLTPQRFLVKQDGKSDANVRFCKDDRNGFVEFWVDGGVGSFCLGNERSFSYCCDLSGAFEGLEDTTLTGMEGTWRGPYHHCTRLIAVQLE